MTSISGLPDRSQFQDKDSVIRDFQLVMVPISRSDNQPVDPELVQKLAQLTFSFDNVLSSQNEKPIIIALANDHSYRYSAALRDANGVNLYQSQPKEVAAEKLKGGSISLEMALEITAAGKAAGLRETFDQLKPAPQGPEAPLPTFHPKFDVAVNSYITTGSGRGAPVALKSKIKGRYVGIDFSADWCGPCKIAVGSLLNDNFFQQSLKNGNCSMVTVLNEPRDLLSWSGVVGNSAAGKAALEHTVVNSGDGLLTQTLGVNVSGFPSFYVFDTTTGELVKPEQSLQADSFSQLMQELCAQQ